MTRIIFNYKIQQVRAADSVTREHLQSTNLIHLNALVGRLFSSENPTEVLKPFKLSKSFSRLTVDIICNGGAAWVKVIARNARALTLISLGNGEYGQKSVLDQAQNYLKCAALYPHHYKLPVIIFHFAYGIEASLSTKLRDMGVVVEGEQIESGGIDVDTGAFGKYLENIWTGDELFFARMLIFQ